MNKIILIIVFSISMIFISASIIFILFAPISILEGGGGDTVSDFIKNPWTSRKIISTCVFIFIGIIATIISKKNSETIDQLFWSKMDTGEDLSQEFDLDEL